MTNEVLPRVCVPRVRLRRYGVQVVPVGQVNLCTGQTTPTVAPRTTLSRHRFLTRKRARHYARLFRITGPGRDGTIYDAWPVELVAAP